MPIVTLLITLLSASHAMTTMLMQYASLSVLCYAAYVLLLKTEFFVLVSVNSLTLIRLQQLGSWVYCNSSCRMVHYPLYLPGFKHIGWYIYVVFQIHAKPCVYFFFFHNLFIYNCIHNCIPSKLHSFFAMGCFLFVIPFYPLIYTFLFPSMTVFTISLSYIWSYICSV